MKGFDRRCQNWFQTSPKRRFAKSMPAINHREFFAQSAKLDDGDVTEV
jgi:hypothetical protein